MSFAAATPARADEPGSGRVSSARSRASSDALCARTIELPRWPLASLASAATVAAGPRLAIESLRGALLWLMAFSGAFVFIEPSPYEVVGLFTIFMFAVTGLSLPRALAPLLLLLVLLNIGYAMAVLQVIDQPKPVIWVGVSAYLAVTAVFYAAALATNTEQRLDLIMRGYVAAAVIASLVAIGAYFRLFGGVSDMFLRYSRASGTFNDPNVLSAFVILPALLAFQRVLVGRFSEMVRGSVVLLILMAALLLSFSRAAWGQFVLCAVLLMWLTFVTSRSPQQRFRIITLTLVGVFVMAAFVAALLSVGKVAELFEVRASLEQSYDVGHLGRFGRYFLGFQLALDQPFGLGPLQFNRFFPEDPHNTFLNAFMTGGWLGGVAYPTLSLVTLFFGMRFVATPTPWRSTYQAVYVAYVGTIVESVIIDIDHWRHYYLILGVLWGLMAASVAYRRSPPVPGYRSAA
jgi:O-antigen ligase